MKKLLKTAAVVAGVLGFGFGGAAQAEPDYPFAATGFVAGGGSFLDSDVPFLGDREIGYIVAGGDIVVPLSGYWNIQLGGAFHTEHEHLFFGPDTLTQFQGGAIGFWRSPGQGVFGLEAGLYSSSEFGQEYVKLGGVAEYHHGEMATFNIYGGALLPIGNDFFFTDSGTGFYTGGHITWYASSNMALAAFGQYTQLNFDEIRSGESDQNNLLVGGKVRYLTSMPGVELFASGAFQSCWADSQSGVFNVVDDGVQIMAGINIRLGGNTGSLVEIDRSNALDTRAWTCYNTFVFN